MEREKKRPELNAEVLGVNPFVEGLQIYVTKKAYKVLNKFEQVDEKQYELESTPYTKVFDVVGDRKQVSDLPIRSKELYLFLIHSIRAAHDYIWIDRHAYMAQMGITSVNTYKSAIKGLSENLYIYPHYKIKDVFWINPHYFFKGSRINKYNKNIILKGKIEVK